jgi:hypothetical protein
VPAGSQQSLPLVKFTLVESFDSNMTSLLFLTTFQEDFGFLRLVIMFFCELISRNVHLQRFQKKIMSK